MSNPLDQMFGTSGSGPPDTRPELQRIMRATQLQAALLAHQFFTEQRNLGATVKLSAIIQKLTTKLVKDAS